MSEFIITSDQMKMLAESVGYFVNETIGEVVIDGETLPDADELRAENRKLRELCKDMYENPYALSECWECPHCGNGCISNCYYHDRLRELGVIE